MSAAGARSWKKFTLRFGFRNGARLLPAEPTIISIFALALALAFTGPAFAGDVTAPKTEADCQKAGGIWNAATNKCAPKKM